MVSYVLEHTDLIEAIVYIIRRIFVTWNRVFFAKWDKSKYICTYTNLRYVWNDMKMLKWAHQKNVWRAKVNYPLCLSTDNIHFPDKNLIFFLLNLAKYFFLSKMHFTLTYTKVICQGYIFKINYLIHYHAVLQNWLDIQMHIILYCCVQMFRCLAIL